MDWGSLLWAAWWMDRQEERRHKELLRSVRTARPVVIESRPEPLGLAAPEGEVRWEAEHLFGVDVLAVALVGLGALTVVYTTYRRMLFFTFDPEVAEVSGVRVARMETLQMLMLAATVLFTMKVVGVLLISALLVTPAVIARMLTNSFARMLVIAPVVGAVCGGVGMFVSYHIDVSPGATIILLPVLAFVFGPREAIPIMAVTAYAGREDEDRIRAAAGEAVGWQVIPSPGHASHHVCYLRDGTLLAGDACGVRILPRHAIQPVSPPPDIDVEAWARTIDEIERWQPERLALIHFGIATDVAAHLAGLRAELATWSERVRSGMSEEEFVAAVSADVGPDAERYGAVFGFAMSWKGLRRYWDRRAATGG